MSLSVLGRELWGHKDHLQHRKYGWNGFYEMFVETSVYFLWKMATVSPDGDQSRGINVSTSPNVFPVRQNPLRLIKRSSNWWTREV
ncbi:predicted protein [Botrytis cinerea T4]|uniref:Uncharacterized protein n=1 Tax=Botryotinia fuckeliana (strain T4) TaxID=999810 RepID=G2YZ53_BOTF4|nr:predicted protein [Botrytis cinerea T4]